MKNFAESLAFDIHCIDVDYMRPRLACSYLVIHQGKAAFIDCGTSLTVPRLLSVLHECKLDLTDVEYVIPTHIHLDHAGGAGVLMQKFPNAKLVVHPKGVRHLIDPQRLIDSVRQVYGDELYDSLYGEIIPVDEHRVIAAEDNYCIDLNGRSIQVADTPGHARHHFCLYDELSNGWFTGDTFGLCYPDISISTGHYLLPTTSPVQFEPDAWQQTIKRLLEKNPQRMYLTHFGMVEDVQQLANKLSQDLVAYTEIALSQKNQNHRVDKLKESLTQYTLNELRELKCSQEEAIILELLKTDITLNAQGLDVWLQRQEKSK
ncbi:MAG: MBL fold metallo-hydrolase [Gammaproteobacteria bacterium]|nr:MBL fold metallo-hydrolase [Gammaproteobacteria bacterium]